MPVGDASSVFVSRFLTSMKEVP